MLIIFRTKQRKKQDLFSEGVGGAKQQPISPTRVEKNQSISPTKKMPSIPECDSLEFTQSTIDYYEKTIPEVGDTKLVSPSTNSHSPDMRVIQSKGVYNIDEEINDQEYPPDFVLIKKKGFRKRKLLGYKMISKESK